MRNLGVQTPQHWFIHSFLRMCSQRIGHGYIGTDRFTVWGASLGLCLVVFSVKGNKHKTCWSNERQDFAVICCMFSLRFAQSNGHLFSAKTVVLMFVLFHVFICDFNRDTCLCFWSLVFGIFFTLVHLRPNWGLSLALQCPGKMARKEEVVLWTSDTFHFIVLCHMPLFYMLASLCSLAIFEDQTIGMLRWFKQWY